MYRRNVHVLLSTVGSPPTLLLTAPPFSPPLQVANVVPSISAVIGGTTPERYIWRLGMAFFSFPRMFDAFLYYNFFSHSPGSGRPASLLLNRLTWFLHVWQYLSLFTLSYVSSTEYFGEGISTFVVCGCVCYLYLHTCLLRTCVFTHTRS